MESPEKLELIFSVVTAHPEGYISRNGHKLVGGNLMGYRIHCMSIDSMVVGFREHRIIAHALIPNPLNLPYINHKDSDKSNNRVENLEWCTAKQNTHHMIAAGKFNPQGEENPTARFTEKDVREFFRLKSEGVSGAEIARMYGCDKSTINKILKGILWSHIRI